MTGLLAAVTSYFRRKTKRGQIIRVTTPDSVIEYSVTVVKGSPVTAITATGSSEKPIIEVIDPDIVNPPPGNA